MGERLQRINFALSTIPHYDGNVNTLNVFINAVTLVNELLQSINPPLDAFEISTAFLAIRSRITGKALESVKDLYIKNWDDLKICLLKNFDDKSSSVTILTEILNITTIKNPNIFFNIIKEKFNNFKAKIFIEEEVEDKRNAVMNFVEKLIITHFITNLNDPFRNNLATRNPQTLNDVEKLIRNDLQYLRINQTQRPMNNNYNNHFGRNKPPVYQPKFNTNKIFPSNKQFNVKPQTQTRNDTFKPEPMSVQTRQTRPFMPRETYYNDEGNVGESSNTENITNDENDCQDHFLDLGPEPTRKKF